MPYDMEKDSFGTPEVVVDAAQNGKSVTFPRVSPDGKYVLYAEGDYGQFHIWHKSSDLWVKDLQADTCYALTAANSDDVDSYHSWSSNGRWIVFSTRRMDGNYTRPFIAYFGKDGKAHKAFCLPQRDPEHNVLLMKSYNVPELSKNAVKVSTKTLHDVVYNTEGETAKYVGQPRVTDAQTGATRK
jgi:dipeptidyl aminopeptidase/acylaminoacyl peptidase